MNGATDLDLATVDHLLSTTRAVRRRLDLERPVPRELVLECIALAQQAPTMVNSQLWRWIIVTDPTKRAAIADLYRELSDQVEGSRPQMFEDEQTQRVHQSARHLATVLADVPVLVIPCMRPMFDVDPMGHALASATFGSIFPAVWSFQLAARARGFGTALTTLHLAREAEVSQLLGIPDEWRQVALLPLAFYTGETFQPAVRPPAETITAWDHWDL